MPSLAPANISGYFEKLRQEWQEDQKRNEGYVWTIRVKGTSTISMALATVDYTIDLNCSHVGPTAFGAYCGELSMDFKGDVGGTKALLALMGIHSTDDMSGWFRNDRFVMKLKPFSAEDEAGFIQTFDVGQDAQITPTGDPAKDAAAQAGADFANNLINSILGNLTSSQAAKADAQTEGEAPSGLWYDWAFHMTEGDMGTYFKMSGGPVIWIVNAEAHTDAQYSHVQGHGEVGTIFGQFAAERYDEPIDSPFPYTVRVYPNGRVRFTLYNYKGGPVTVVWPGTIDRVPVEQTTTV